jgi:hypothetical protein
MIPIMPIIAQFKNLVQYTTLAATSARNIADTTGVPFLSSTAALALSILKYIEVG